MEKERTQVNDIDRSAYDIKDSEEGFYRVKEGLTKEIVLQISEEKHDPEWMRDFRLKSLDIYNELKVPDWGPDISGLNIDDIVTYVRPNTKMSAKWEDVPEDIKNTFERLGIPQAERVSLAGVGAQYDSELVYHNVKEEVSKTGVIYTDMESALTGEYEDMVKEHFMKLVPPTDHKFAALHGAVWSGGSFVYVPPGVKLDIPYAESDPLAVDLRALADEPHIGGVEVGRVDIPEFCVRNRHLRQRNLLVSELRPRRTRSGRSHDCA